MRTAYAVALMILGLLIGVQDSGSQQVTRDAATCADCHTAADADKQRALTHADSVSCTTCHHIGFTNDPDVAAARRIEACIGCHEDVAMPHQGVDDVTPDCAACHSIHGDQPLPEAKASISSRCASCHTTPHSEHAPGAEGAPSCAECHTMHSGDPFAYNEEPLLESCVGCHEAAHPSHYEVEGILECTECHAATESRALEIPTGSELCATCHGTVPRAHDDVEVDERPECSACHDFVTDPVLADAGPVMARRCGTCHEETLDSMLAGGHGGFLEGDSEADLPKCTTCHTAHMGAQEARDKLKISAAIACMKCHGDASLSVQYGLPSQASRSYADDFHGATMQFLLAEGGTMGERDVMLCSDCHGVHDVAALDQEAVAEVCIRCHDEGDDRLAGAWLGHEPVAFSTQPIIWLVRLFYYFLIPFMLGGLAVTILFQLVDQRREGARVMQTEGVRRIINRLKGQKPAPEPMVQRFNRTERLEHLGSAFTFIALVVTGLPQTRPDLPIARAIIGLMGGIWSTRIIHRTIGILFVILMVTHVTRAIVNAIKRRRLPIMVPVRKDFEDMLQTFRHFLFKEPMPRVGKFDFAEKYEYWGLFLGGIVMSSTGLILLFPELVSQLLPGVLVAATRVMHGLEATFAVMVVILWHSYGVMLRPEVFPLDTSIFSGKMSVARLKHEHRDEYDRLFPEDAASDPDGGEASGSAFMDLGPQPSPGD